MSVVSFAPAEIISVEKGNILKVNDGIVAVEDCVVAFSIKPSGFERTVKALLKGKVAYYTYNMYLSECFTQADVIQDDDFFMVKIPSAGFSGTLRESRPKEVVYHNIKDVEFLFHYKVIQK